MEEQLIEAEKYKAKEKEKEKEKENKNMRVKARIRKYFKHNKRDFKLWEQCGEEWIANDGICDEGIDNVEYNSFGFRYKKEKLQFYRSKSS